MRLVVLRSAAVCAALSWLVFPGFGLPDLLVTWDPAWEVVLEAGWGLFSTVLVAGAFVSVAVRPRRCAPALVQLSIATAALAVSALAGAEAPALVLAGLLALETAVIAALVLPGQRAVRPRGLRPLGLRPSVPLLVLATAGAVPWALYAVAMYRATRRGAPLDVSVGIDHFAVQGALAVTVLAVGLAAALWPGGRRLLGGSAGLAAAYLGLVSLAWPGRAAGYGAGWSALAVVWGVGVAACALAASPRVARQPTGPEERIAERSR